ncbi:MAG: pyridoxamine 5'-phosphate oxidase [Actinomycetota bacterium]|nr:pyridoxamine 5'-phosphate oxidase [Actinomycetota bacterium]
MAADPIDQFSDWFEQAQDDVPLPEAMTLATVDADGEPNARMVLLKGADEQGFRFFSNYESIKGAELEANPAAALVIYWRELDRQVRVRGQTRRLPDADSDAYFATRARDSRIAASVSPQSRPVEREELERRYEQASAELEGAAVPRPRNWGGYLLEPREIEFWQGREGRMHDRFRYRRTERGGWKIERLAP